MNQKPKYLLKYGRKEIENDSLEELVRFAKTITDYYEIFRVYKSAMEEPKKILTIETIEEANRMFKRGYSRDIVGKRLGLTPHYMNKLFGKNAIVSI